MNRRSISSSTCLVSTFKPKIVSDELENNKTFMYCYKGMSAEEIVTPIAEQVFVTAKSHPIIVESHSNVELHMDAKLHRDAEHQSDSAEL